MPAAVTGAFARLKNWVGEFSLPQKTLALIGIAAVVLGIVLAASWANRPTMSPLFSGLSGEDAAAVVDQLTAAGVTYELTDGGSTVLVPAESVYDQRIALAAEGLPTEEGGYSLLDDMGMTSSDFQQQVSYQRALEGELAKTVRALDGVSNATVHLALPEESVFAETAAEPTASVFVQAETGKTLDSAGVQAVVNLVSSAVAGMDPANVSVVDAEGAVLTTEPGSGPDGATEYEERVAGQVQAMLNRVVGAGNAVVSVSAELGRDATQRTSETFTPAEGAPPLSETRSTEEYQGGGQAVGGVLGPDNIAVPNGGEAGHYTREDATSNNAVNKVTEHTTVNPGGVTRQSVSVVVDSVAAAGVTVEELEDIVAVAAGVDLERGDQVAVAQMAFDTSTADAAQQALEAQAEAEAEAAAAAQRDALIRWGLVAVVLLAVVIALVRRARRNREREDIDLGELEVMQLPEPEPLEPDTSMLEPVPEVRAIEPDATETARMGVVAMVDEDPAAVADRLRQWMAVKQ
ncbi:flagellar basal-body MS-ring/collar protein FliF [Georgenia phoenicis]|uniref:flagellar basal-body MS-ring/collar protein FliF n=1 Tax=unclassified Georgenia TaxID=2626815 RepID=UPI0039B0E0A7